MIYRQALLNVLACHVLPAVSFVHWQRQLAGFSYTVTIHRFFECLARMLEGIRTGAWTLLLTVTSHSDRVRLLLKKSTSSSSKAAISAVFFELYALVYKLSKLKLMTVNLYSYVSDLWSNKNDTRRGQNQRFLVGTAEWECSDPRREQWVSFFLFIPSLICFSSLVLRLKVMLLFQMAWCYMENRQEEYFTENIKICQHADMIMAA